MGLGVLGHSSAYDCKPAPNPNPYNYKIERYVCTEFGILVEVKYPDCTTYEGRKIILYKGINLSIDQLKREKSIDPHFQQGMKIFKPFARLEPTEDGWLCGLKMIGAFK